MAIHIQNIWTLDNGKINTMPHLNEQGGINSTFFYFSIVNEKNNMDYFILLFLYKIMGNLIYY